MREDYGEKLIGENFYQLFTTTAAFLMLIRLSDIFQWRSSKTSKVSGILRVKFGPKLTPSENGYYFLKCNENNFFNKNGLFVNSPSIIILFKSKRKLFTMFGHSYVNFC